MNKQDKKDSIFLSIMIIVAFGILFVSMWSHYNEGVKYGVNSTQINITQAYQKGAYDLMLYQTQNAKLVYLVPTFNGTIIKEDTLLNICKGLK